MGTTFRPPRYRPQFRDYLSKLRRDYRTGLPEPTPVEVHAAPEPAAPAAEEGAFEKAMSVAGHAYESLGAPFRYLSEDQYKKHIRAQAGWTPESGMPDPAEKIPTPTGAEMAKAAAFDVGEPPKTHAEAVARGLVGMGGEITQDPVAMALIGGGLGALPPGALRTGAHYGMMGMLGAGVATGAMETAEELERRGEWTPEVTEIATRPAVDAALMLTPYAWRGIKGFRKRAEAPGDPAPEPPPGPKASVPLDNDLAGWDVDSPRVIQGAFGKKVSYEPPTAHRRGRAGTHHLMTRIQRQIADLGRPTTADPPERVAERAELNKSLELVREYGERMDATESWPDPIAELQARREAGLLVSPRVAQEIDGLVFEYERNARVLLGEEGAKATFEVTLADQASTESRLLRLADRLGRNAVRAQRPATESGRGAQQTVSEALDKLWVEIEAAGDTPKADALRIRYKSLEDAFMRGEGNEPAAADLNPRPGETVQEAASRIWAEIMFAEEAGNAQWVQALQARYGVLEAEVAAGRGSMPAEAAGGPVAAPGPALVPPAAPGPGPTPVPPAEPPTAGAPPRLPGPGGVVVEPPKPALPTPPKKPAPPTEGAVALEPLPEAPEVVTRITKKAGERMGPEAEAKAVELVEAARRKRREARKLPEGPEREAAEAEVGETLERAIEEFDVYGLGPSELADLRKAIEEEPEAPPAPAAPEPGKIIPPSERWVENWAGPDPGLKTYQLSAGLDADEIRVDLGRGPEGKGWLVQTHTEEGLSRRYGPFGTKQEATAYKEGMQAAAKRNRAAIRAAALPPAPEPEPEPAPAPAAPPAPPEPTLFDIQEGEQVVAPDGSIGIVEGIRHVEPTRAFPEGETRVSIWRPAQPGLKTAGTTDFRPDQVQPLGRAMFYTSGMSRTKDFLVAAHWKAPFGVDVGELSREGIAQLGTAAARFRGRVFVDSGAYSLFKKNLKQEGVEALEFNQVFDRYGDILEAAGREAGQYANERDWHPAINLVMPDVVGDQEASLGAITDNLEDVQAIIRHPFAEAVVPIQKGEKGLFEQLQATVNAVGRDHRFFTIGLPGNAKAVSVEDVIGFAGKLAEVEAQDPAGTFLAEMPTRIHLLGVGPTARLDQLSSAIRSLLPRAIITSDANQVRSLLRGETTREDAVRGALGLSPDADVSKPDLLVAAGPLPKALMDMDEESREGWIVAVEEILEENPEIQTPADLIKASEVYATAMGVEEATWHLRRRNATAAPDPAVDPLPAPEPDEPPADHDLSIDLAGLLDADQQKALAAALKRVGLEAQSAGQQDVFRAMIRQAQLMREISRLEGDVQALKAIPTKRRSAAQKRQHTSARSELKAATAMLDHGWENLAGTLKGKAEGPKVAKRLRAILEGKGVAREKRQVTGLTAITDGSAAPLARELGIPESEVLSRVREYAKEIDVDEADVLFVLERDLVELDVAGTAAQRADLDSRKDPKSLSQLRALDRKLKNNFLGLPGYGGKRVLDILQAGPDGKDFGKIVAYRNQLYREMEAMQELALEYFPDIRSHLASSAEANLAELQSVAGALSEDLLQEPEPSGQRPALTGGAEGEYPDPGEGEAAVAHLFKTFMWGIRVPGTETSLTTQEAIDAINRGEGRTFARIYRALDGALDNETTAAEATPFDVPDLTPEELGKIGIAEASRNDRPNAGRYGPAPRRPTKRQADFIQLPLGMGVPPVRRPSDAKQSGADAQSQRDDAEGRAPGERRGRAGLRREREPRPADPALAPAPTPKRGVFGVVLARPEETASLPPDFSLIPPEHMEVLGEHQHLAVAKAIAQMQKGEGFLLADGTGVGKTHTILSVASKFAKDKRPVVIVAPSKTLAIRTVDGKPRPTGSYADAAKQLGVPFTFAPSSARPLTLDPGRIYITPYWRLQDINATPETVVVFDEAHNLKNLTKSERGQTGKELGDKAFAVLFSTATPGDTADQFIWAERVGILEGKPVQEQMHDLGMHVTKKTVWIDNEPVVKYFWVPTSEGKTNRLIKKLFERLTAKGSVLKREIDMTAVDVDVREVKLPDEAHDTLARIEEKFPGVGMRRALMLQHQRRQQEPYKLAAAQVAIKQELEAGRSVVVFAERINYSKAERKIFDEAGELVGSEVVAESEGTLRQLRAWLDSESIPFSEIHGDAEERMDEAIESFQTNRSLVVIATVAKGGEGINLDDRTGERPRTMVMMTAPFSSVEMFQAAGRIHRYTTVSPSKVIMLKGDTETDNWNFGINATKMQQLGARVSGQVELLRPDLLNEWNDNLNAADGEVPAGEYSSEWIDEALNKLTNYRPSREIRSAKHRNWTRAGLAALKPKWSEDGGVFTVVSKEQIVFHGYMVDGAFELLRDDPSTWGRIGFKRMPKAKPLLARSPIRDKKGRALIDGFAEATADTPIITEGNLPGDMFSVEEAARRERQRKGEPEPKKPKQKGLFEASRRGRAPQISQAGQPDNGGHDVTDSSLDSILDSLFSAHRVNHRAKLLDGTLPWQMPQRKGKPLEERMVGGARSLFSVLSERLHNFERIDWESGDYAVRTVRDVGAVAQIARNPVIEQAHFIAVKGGKIVGTRQTSSELPSAVSFGAGHVPGQINDWSTSLGADAIYSIHNHPSGNAKPSTSDIKLDKTLHDQIPNYKGSVVIDHEEFFTLTRDASGKSVIDRVRKSTMAGPDPFLNASITAHEFYRTGKYQMSQTQHDLAKGVMDALVPLVRPSEGQDRDWPILIFRDAEDRIREITAVPPGIFLDAELFRTGVEEWGKMAGASNVILALDNPTTTETFMAQAHVGADVVHSAVDVTKIHRRLLDFKQVRTSRVIQWGGKQIDYGVEDAPFQGWREREDDRKYSLRPRNRRPARAGAGGGGDDGGDGPFDWPEALRPGPGETGWQRAVRFAEMRMRRRAAQINMGVDPRSFWDAFIIGADRFSKGMRNFGRWMSSVGEFKGFGDLWRKVWAGLGGILRPESRTVTKRPKVADADTIISRYEVKPKVVRPIREPTARDIERAVEAMMDPHGVDPGTGKPPVRNRKGDVVGTDININTIEDANGVHEATTRIVRALEAQFGQARSYRSWEQAKARAIENGYTEKDIRRLLQEKGSLTDYEIIAGRHLRQEATIDFSNKWGEYKDLVRRAAEETDMSKKAAWETMAAEAQRDAKGALAKAMGIQYTTVAAGAEAGRALAIHRMLVKELTPKERLLWQIAKDKKYGSDEQLSEIAQALEDNDMSRVGDLVRKIYKPTILDKTLEWWLNSILSGPPTQAANITGNSTMQALSVPEAAVASRLEQYGVRQALERWLTGEAVPQERVIGEATQAMKTLTKMKFGIWDSLKLSWDAIWNPEKYAFGAKGEYRPPALGGLFGKVARSPSRWMEGADLGAKMSAARAERSKLTWRMAVTEAREAKVKRNYQQTLERATELEQIVDEYAGIEARRKIDPKGVSKEERMFLVKNKWAGPVIRRMEHQADVMTFRDETMDITKYVTLIRGRYPWLTFMVPFIKTPERIFVQALRRTPMGLARTIDNVRTGKLKGGEASDRLAQGILGTLMSASVYMMARDGQITGSGPSDPRKRRDWLATGKRPYAVKVFDTWVSFARIEPLATTFGFAADLAEAQDDRVAGDIWDKLHYSAIQNITNKTFLEGMISTAEAVGDPDRYGARLYKRMVGGLVPNLLATAARSIDPTIRQTDTIGDTLLARVPWFSRTVRPRLSGTGELIDRGEDPLSRFISPFRYAREAGPERNLERMFLETGYSPSAPPRSMTLPGTMGRKVILNRREQELYALYARRATAFARALTSNGDWSRLDVYAKAEILRRIYRFAHDAGRKAMYRSVLQRMRGGEFEIKRR